MKLQCELFIIIFALTISGSSLIPDDDVENKPKICEPLLLTPFIENKNITEAREKAEVKYDKLEVVKSYSGYFTVNVEFNSNLFFWFFPSESDYENAPVILWLQGGPGVSSLKGALALNGAFEVTDEMELKKKKYYWSQTHSVLYIDNPVGTGFSFTNKDGYAKNQTIIGKHLYLSLLQFFQLFPELLQNDFFITGESYAGKHVPSVSYWIMKENPTAQQKINLKGLAIGNGHCDPENQMGYSEMLYQVGLIDSNGKKLLQAKVDEVVTLIRNEMWAEAYLSANKIIYGDFQEPTLFTNLTGFRNIYNILNINDSSSTNLRKYVNIPAFRKALHVGNHTFEEREKVLTSLIPDFMKSVAPIISELLDHYKILFFHEDYKSAKRHIWIIDGDVAGYVKEAGNIIELLVRNAGHMVALDQPKWALDMITKFTRNQSFC
ncbi:hypothetical protein FQR65_LT11579 [Abscondita terminalis]|nr:hypothetical protein FQR65_LT11579 [Abscondita terminalis]